MGRYPDAKLLALGREFDRQMPAVIDREEECWRLEEIFDAEAKRNKIVSIDRQWKEWCALRYETGLEPAIQHLQEALDAQDVTARAIRETPAHTIAGLAVKVRAHGYDNYAYRVADVPDEEREWPERCYFDLLAEVERMAAQEAVS